MRNEGALDSTLHCRDFSVPTANEQKLKQQQKNTADSVSPSEWYVWDRIGNGKTDEKTESKWNIKHAECLYIQNSRSRFLSCSFVSRKKARH